MCGIQSDDIWTFCMMNFYQANHRFSVNMQRRIYSHATDVAIRPLNEEKAVQVAADLLGELFVFTVVFYHVMFYWFFRMKSFKNSVDCISSQVLL